MVGTTADARDLVRMADAYGPDVVIADIQMPPDHADDGLRAALAIRAARPGTGVLVLSQFLEDRYAFDLVADGAQGVGYLLKEKVGDMGMFTDAVRRVADGGSVLDPDVVARLVGRKRKAGPLDDLTPREREVLALIAQGRSNAGIARELVVTVAAIERHVTSIFDKLGLHSVARGAPPCPRRADLPADLTAGLSSRRLGRAGEQRLRSAAASSCLATNAAAAQVFMTSAGTWSTSAEVSTIRAPAQAAASDAATANPSCPGRLMSSSIPSGHSWPRRPEPAPHPPPLRAPRSRAWRAVRPPGRESAELSSTIRIRLAT